MWWLIVFFTNVGKYISKMFTFEGKVINLGISVWDGRGRSEVGRGGEGKGWGWEGRGEIRRGKGSVKTQNLSECLLHYITSLWAPLLTDSKRPYWAARSRADSWFKLRKFGSAWHWKKKEKWLSQNTCTVNEWVLYCQRMKSGEKCINYAVKTNKKRARDSLRQQRRARVGRKDVN